MRPAPEADVLARGLASEVERRGIGELVGIAVRRADDGDHEVASCKCLAAELEV